MKIRSLFTPCLLAGALTFSAAAFAQDGSPAPTAPVPAGATTPAGVTTSTGPGTSEPATSAGAKTSGPHWTEKEKTFAMKASGGNMAEVKLGELAGTNAESEDVKTFGQSMVTDHGKANTELEGVLTKKGMPFEPKLNAKQKATYDKLSALKGAAFDKAYTLEAVKDHEMDVAEYKAAVATTKDEDLKGYQTATIPVIEHHLMMAKEMKAKMTGAEKKG